MTFVTGPLQEFKITHPVVVDEGTLLATLTLPDGTEIPMIPIKIDLAEVLASAEDFIATTPHETEQA